MIFLNDIHSNIKYSHRLFNNITHKVITVSSSLIKLVINLNIVNYILQINFKLNTNIYIYELMLLFMI